MSTTSSAMSEPSGRLRQLEQRLQRLQQGWQRARGEIRKFGFVEGEALDRSSGSLEERAEAFMHRASAGQNPVLSLSTATQREAQAQRSLETLRDVQAALEQVRIAVSHAAESGSLQQAQSATETTTAGQRAFRTWFSGVETVLEQYEQRGAVMQTALAQAQAALTQAFQSAETALSERNTLLLWVTELEAALDQRQEMSTSAEAALAQAQAGRETAQAEYHVLRSRVTELEMMLAQREEANAVSQAALMQAQSARETARSERDVLRNRLAELETSLARREVSVETVQKELHRVEGIRTAIMEELEQWEQRYLEVQTELETVRLDFARISSETQEQATAAHAVQHALRERVAQLEAMLVERDQALAAGQQELLQVSGEHGNWQMRYHQAEEELRALRLDLSRVTMQLQEQNTAFASVQRERALLQSRMAEMEQTVVQRGVSVESLQEELRRAMEVQEMLLSERMQWEGRYREAIEDVQVKLSRIQTSAESRAYVSGSTTSVTRMVRGEEETEARGEATIGNE